MLKVILVIILALGLIIAGGSTGCSPEGPAPGPQVGKPAPNFQLPNLGGQSVSLSDFQGKPVLINFWASWCRPCVYEMPYIQEVFEEWSGQGLVVLAINIGESLSQVKEFMESHDLSFPVLLDMEGKVAEQYNIGGIPTTFSVDKDGIIQAMRVGAFPNKAAIEKSLNKIIP